MYLLKRCIIESESRIDLESTLFSGQTFRWNKIRNHENIYWGIIGSDIVMIRQETPVSLEAMSTSESIGGVDAAECLRRYFTLDVDTGNLFPDHFRVSYSRIWGMVGRYLGVRLLRQAPFEAMVTFMCAQGIGMGLIRRQVEMIAGRYGQPVVAETPWGKIRAHLFPAPSALASATVDELSACTNNNRIRAANIMAMARLVESGAVSLDVDQSPVRTMEELRESLCRMRGIGMKIADCIALFGFGRFEAFPVDTHVRQYLRDWFGVDTARKSLTHANYLLLQAEAGAILGPGHAGYAGHILFHCWRKEVRRMTAY